MEPVIKEQKKPEVPAASVTDRIVEFFSGFGGKQALGQSATLATKIGADTLGVAAAPTVLATRPLGARKLVLGSPAGLALDNMIISESGNEEEVAARPGRTVEIGLIQQQLKIEQAMKVSPPMWMADP